MKRIFKFIFWMVALWLLMRTFVFRIYKIEDASMSGNLYESEYVVINKLAYGARLPITPLHLFKAYLGWIKIPYTRLPGSSEIQRNDVLAYNFEENDEDPIDMRNEYIQRCIALPGDTLQIKNGIAYINSQTKEPANIYLPYTIISTAKIDSVTFEVTEEGKERNTYHYFTSTEKAASLLKTGAVQSVSVNISESGKADLSLFTPEALKWNQDHFGPLWIPKEGDSLRLTEVNLQIYEKMIRRFEKVKISREGSSVMIDGIPAKYYVFTNNYYFMLGDNRHRTSDSRERGFIPESHIIGKVSFVLYSNEDGRSLSRIK